MTKYHLFVSSQDDVSEASSQYIGVFDSPVDAYKRLENSGADYGELMVINAAGELELIGEATTDPIRETRTDTRIAREYGWTIDGKPVIAKTRYRKYKATKSQIEAAAREFAEKHQVIFLGIDEYANPNNLQFYITVRFDWSPKYNIDWHKRERVERGVSYQWEFDDNDRTRATARELINQSAGEQLKKDNMGHDEFAKYAQGMMLATGMTPYGLGLIPVGSNFD